MSFTNMYGFIIYSFGNLAWIQGSIYDKNVLVFAKSEVKIDLIQKLPLPSKKKLVTLHNQ